MEKSTSFGTSNSRNDDYFFHSFANYMSEDSRVSLSYDETSKGLTDFFYVFFKANSCFLPEGKNCLSLLVKAFRYWLLSSFHLQRCGNAMFAFKASLVRFTLIEFRRRAMLALLSKPTSSREISQYTRVALVQKVLH